LDEDDVGFFSFLKKKDDAPAPRQAAPAVVAPASVLANPVTRSGLATEDERRRQREIARATAAKIDEIELEMTSDIFDDDAWGGKRRTPAVAAGAARAADVAPEADDLPDAAASPSNAPVVEEAAILYANGQLHDAEQALRASLPGPAHERQAWWMLFDLYQVTGREADFDSIAIDYASHFEASPPAYKPLAAHPGQARSATAFAGATPTAVLSGRLDAQSGPVLARVLAPSPSPVVRIEFQAIAHVTPDGCALLLQALQRLRKDGRELMLAGADHLVALLRPMLAIGARAASQAPWLLLLELLLLAGREKDFEETAMDYCVTYEISPPSFEAPRRPVAHVGAAPAVAGDRFLLPDVIEGDAAALLAAIGAHADKHGALVLDCSRLARIDYMAATALAGRLRNLAHGDGAEGARRRIELRDLNHLTAALLRLLGAGEQARLYAHPY
jgi:anti-anti-sigma regulatory factor